jgi:hypothetical protein
LEKSAVNIPIRTENRTKEEIRIKFILIKVRKVIDKFLNTMTYKRRQNGIIAQIEIQSTQTIIKNSGNVKILRFIQQ